ncbi:MAG: hypothetical protein BWY17_01740 [Deltaproteobacteria bacterium ADurb.Bin207]|jgi:hypothetical protein|nr:MAG: hypothetical protein BWY17_01740 [Deltaproteobacteria bacterium ADurb.Bin207]
METEYSQDSHFVLSAFALLRHSKLSNVFEIGCASEPCHSAVLDEKTRRVQEGPHAP